MNSNQLAKKNLFKVKKIVCIEKIPFSSFDKGDTCVGVVTPYFDESRNEFSESRIMLLTLEGEKLNFRTDAINIESTRIMNRDVKEKLEKIAEFSKEVHKTQIEKIKFYEEYKKKEQKLRDKVNKQNDSIEKLFNQLKKAQGFLTISEIVKSINKFLPEELYQDNWCKKTYTANISKNYRLEIRFNKNSIAYANIEHEIDFGKWCNPEQYDFIYEEYDRTLHVENVDNSEDFEKLKNRHFKKINESELKKAKVTQHFSADIGDKDSLYIAQELRSELNIELKKENLKEITKRLQSLLKLI